MKPKNTVSIKAVNPESRSEIHGELNIIRDALDNLQDRIDKHSVSIQSICVPTETDAALTEAEYESDVGRQLQAIRITIQRMESQMATLTNSLAI